MDQAAITLSNWVTDHGPLWPDAALVVALQACAQASQMTDPELGAVIGSLNATWVVRRSTGGWEWRPTRAAAAAAGTTDADVIERLGALLFYALTGRPVADALAEASTVQTRLRNQRPDLTPAVADLVIRALSTRQSRRGRSTSSRATSAECSAARRQSNGDAVGDSSSQRLRPCWWWRSERGGQPGRSNMSRATG